MEENGRKVSPYKGVWLVTFLLIIVPIIFYIIIRLIMFKFQPSLEKDIKEFSSLAVGFGLGFVFHLACIIAGLFKGTIVVIIKRIKEFFETLNISFKLAIKSYFDNVKEDGLVFYIYFIIVGTNLGLALYGLIKFILVYNK